MSNQSTPGPWTVLAEPGPSEVRTVVAGDFQVCDCVGLTPDGDPDGGDTYAGWAVNQANARLIAAAPEMARLLKQIANDAQPRRTGPPLNHSQWLSEVEALVESIGGAG
jgi:hypothetical protein